MSRGIRHAIFLTRSDRTRLLSLTGHPNCRAIVWFQDDSRVGQKGSLTYVWAPIGSCPLMV
ncbi:MAG: hypothetical protein WB902_25320, partial [Acetobacteraceae bacterium]